MSDNLYLFANNNGGQAENNGSYRLYDMKVEGDSEGVSSGIDYVNYLDSDGECSIDTKLPFNSSYKYVFNMYVLEYISSAIFSSNNFTYNAVTNNLKYGTFYGFPSYQGNEANHRNAWGTDNLLKVFDNGKYYIGNTLVSSVTTDPLDGDNVILFGNSISRLRRYQVYIGDNLLQDLKPCLDTKGVPCLYDEVSKKYFYNKGTGTFGYKKKLRNFQPVLDSNNMPCLLDKINNKFYYNKSGEVFKTKEKVVKKLTCIKQDGASYIDTNIKSKDILGGTIEIKCGSASFDRDNKWDSNAVFGIGGGSSTGDKFFLGIQYNYVSNIAGFDSSTEEVSEDKIHTYKCIGVNYSSDKNIYVASVNGTKGAYCGILSQGFPIYSFKVWTSEGTLIQHLVPAVDENNNIGMYDEVTKTFFLNQGTGTFGYEIEELKGECYEVACTTEDIVNNINPLLSNVKFKVLDNKTISMPKSGSWTISQFDGQSNKGLKLKAYTKYTIIMKPLSGNYVLSNTTCNVCVTDKKRYTLNLDKPTIVETGYKGEFLLYPHISNSPVEKIGIIVLEGEYPDAIYNSFDNIQASTHAEYIESNGTQYIDTGVVPNSNTDIDMTCRLSAMPYYFVGYKSQVNTPTQNTSMVIEMDFKYANARGGHGNILGYDRKNFFILEDGTYSLDGTTSTSVKASTTKYDKIKLILNLESKKETLYVNDVKVGEGEYTYTNTRLLVGGSYIEYCSFYTHYINAYRLSDMTPLFLLRPCLGKYTWNQDNFEYTIPKLRNILNNTEYQTVYGDALATKFMDYGYDSNYIHNKLKLINVSATQNPSANESTKLQYSKTVYEFNGTTTNTKPNLVVSSGATLTLGNINLEKLNDDDIETATNNGWSLT
jgi:hypothetical protein